MPKIATNKYKKYYLQFTSKIGFGFRLQGRVKNIQCKSQVKRVRFVTGTPIIEERFTVALFS